MADPAQPVPYHWSYGAEGQPGLIALHGIGSCADAFMAQVPLAGPSGRRLVAWDAPGYRHSADPTVEPGLDGYADAVISLLDDLGLERADVLGVSWGGVIATRLALRAPERIRSLILVDTSVGAGVNPETAEAMRSRTEALVELGLDRFARDRAPLLVHPEARPETIDSAARLMTQSIRMPSYQWACNSMAEADHRPDLKRIGAPTLVVVGNEDRVTGPKAAARLADGIADAELVTIDGAGHLANQEQPEAFNGAVIDFLQRRVPT